jgi:hypothetical protein
MTLTEEQNRDRLLTTLEEVLAGYFLQLLRYKHQLKTSASSNKDDLIIQVAIVKAKIFIIKQRIKKI